MNKLSTTQVCKVVSFKVSDCWCECGYKLHKRNKNNTCLDIPEIMKTIEKGKCKKLGFGHRSWDIEPDFSRKFKEERMNRIKEDNGDTLQQIYLGFKYKDDLETRIADETPLSILLAYEAMTPYEYPDHEQGLFENFNDSDFTRCTMW